MNDTEGVELDSQGQRPWNDSKNEETAADMSEFKRETFLAPPGR